MRKCFGRLLTFEGLWVSHGRDFVGVLYAGGDIGEEIEEQDI